MGLLGRGLCPSLNSTRCAALSCPPPGILNDFQPLKLFLTHLHHLYGGDELWCRQECMILQPLRCTRHVCICARHGSVFQSKNEPEGTGKAKGGWALLSGLICGV